MALSIRLARAGAKKRPFYLIVVADARMPRAGRFIENLGTYNSLWPKAHEDRGTLVGRRLDGGVDVGRRGSGHGPVIGAHQVVLQVGEQQAEGAEQSRRRGHQEAPDAERLRQARGMDPTARSP